MGLIDLMKQKKKYTFLCFGIILIVVISGAPMPILIQVLIDRVLPDHDGHGIVTIMWMFIVLILVQLVSNLILSILSSKWVQMIVTNIRNSLLDNCFKSGKILTAQEANLFETLIVSDAEIIGNDFQHVFISGSSAIVSIVIYLSLIFILSPYLAAFILISLPLFIFLNMRLSNISKKQFQDVQGSKDKVLLLLNDVIHGMKFIRIYGIYKDMTKNYRTVTNHMKKTATNYAITMTFLSSVITLIAVSVPFLVLVAGCFLVFHGSLTIGRVIAGYTYATAIYTPIATLIGLLPLLKQQEASVNRMTGFTNGLEKIKQLDTINEVSNQVPEIEMNHVGYSYDGDNVVVNDFSAMFYSGKIYQIGGPNGSGKTTLLNCISGLLNITTGSISVKHGKGVTLVPSEPFLVNGTIYDNLTLGVVSIDNQLLDELLKVTGLQEDLARNNQDALSKVSTYTEELSLGQIQKIKLIRAILTKPDVLLLDEILSNIERGSQIKILTFLKLWLKNHVLIVVSHNNDLVNSILNPSYIEL
ncbi:ABC transporter transmembrane domain-containing protein [Lactiplantibacillus paraplantarum]